jgi:K+-transporting ATPase ATPase B chain
LRRPQPGAEADFRPEAIVSLAARDFGFTPDRSIIEASTPFSAESRMSGTRLQDGTGLLKGAPEAVLATLGSKEPVGIAKLVEGIARTGGTPLLVAQGDTLLGVVHLKDVVRDGVKERMAQLRQLGIRSIMITGDNPLTAAAIAAEAGVDDWVANATPVRKLEYIREQQRQGRVIAMCGDGTNDAPALAQADLGVAMNLGTETARQASNMIDLDSDPMKLMEVIRVGRRLRLTRVALAAFAISTDVAKVAALLLAVVSVFYDNHLVLQMMRTASPYSAVLSAIIFNALALVALMWPALSGVRTWSAPVSTLVRKASITFGILGVLTPFVAIKAIGYVLPPL